MPIYAYRASGEQACDYCRGGFEKIQRLGDDPIQSCPECSVRVVKVIAAANLAPAKVSLGRNELEKHGFTQYRKLEKGVYEKTAGKGPTVISDKEK